MKTTWGIAFGSIVAWTGVAAAQLPDEEETEEETTTDDMMIPEVPEETPEEEAPTQVSAASLSPKISGHVDGTYNYNVMDPAGGINAFHSYSVRANTFALNLAHVAMTGNDDHLSYAVEIDAGFDAALNSAAYGASLYDIQEAWAHYTTDSKLGLKAGKFVTTMGIEVIENTANPTISRGFLFGLAEPATHVGALGTYQVDDQIDVAVGLVNGWDLLLDNNSLRTLMAKVGLTQDKLIGTFSALVGPEQGGNNDDFRMAFDATAVIKMSQMDLWVQGNFGRETFNDGDVSATWFGLGVQPVYPIDDKLSIGARAEVFVDPDGARTGVTLPDGVTLINVSAAPAYKLHDNLTLRGEVRVDFATEDVYASGRGPENMQLIALTEVLLTFGQ